ncbi:MAG: glycosyltransferase [Saezia sp.]
MKKILHCLNRNQFIPYDYNLPYEEAMRLLGGNSGNNIFQFALQKMLSVPSQEVTVDTDFLSRSLLSKEYFDAINSEYDFVVFSPANVLSEYATKDSRIVEWTEKIKQLKIPVLAVGVGAQSDADYSLDFVSYIKNNAIEFVEAILKSGGGITTRGHFTSEVIAKLGFSQDAYHTLGCPSMMVMGENLSIDHKKVAQEEFAPFFNGFLFWNNSENHQFLKKYERSAFLCQDEFYRLLYKPQELTWKEIQYLQRQNSFFYDMYMQDKIKLYGDFPSWHHAVKDRYSFSMGCRIHGNILPMLAGIPAFIDSFDSRVRELAEYYDIPHAKLNGQAIDPYELYMNADYTAFNENHPSRFKKYKDFFALFGLSIDSEKVDFETQFPISSFPEFEISRDYKGIISVHKYIYHDHAQQMIDHALKSGLSETKDSSPIENLSLKELEDVKKAQKRIAFVTTEFGFFTGHGGIAAYLYNICKTILETTDYKVTILAIYADKNCDLLRHENFTLQIIRGHDVYMHRSNIFSLLSNKSYDYIEFIEYQGLGLDCVLAKKKGEAFQNTLLVTNNHTASRECFEWSTNKDIMFAPPSLQHLCYEEEQQMKHSDYNIAPSNFLASYVKEKYRLPSNVLFFANPINLPPKTKEVIKNGLEKEVDLEEFADSFNIILITRFEGRKNHLRLVKAFTKLCDTADGKVRLFLAGNSVTNPATGEDCRYEVYKNLHKKYHNHVYFYDFMSKSKQEELFAIADLSVMPSTFENQPMAMLECIMIGVPVIASKYSGCADYTPAEMLFDPFEEDDLYEKLAFYYKQSQEQKEKLKAKQFANLQACTEPEVCIFPRFVLPL